MRWQLAEQERIASGSGEEQNVRRLLPKTKEAP